jgi:hypothetical protein
MNAEGFVGELRIKTKPIFAYPHCTTCYPTTLGCSGCLSLALRSIEQQATPRDPQNTSQRQNHYAFEDPPGCQLLVFHPRTWRCSARYKPARTPAWATSMPCIWTLMATTLHWTTAQLGTSPLTRPTSGVGGTTAAVGRGSVKWMLTDEDDELHMFIMHNVNYVPTLPLRLISPQQLSCDLGDSKARGTYITTYASESNFVWRNKQYRKPVIHRWNCNIPIVRAGPIWDDALVQHIHDASSHPNKKLPTVYCCFIAANEAHRDQEAGM